MIIKNANVLTDDFVFEKIDVKTDEERISYIGEVTSDKNIIDGNNCYLIPGFVDIHTHGCVGYDTCDANYDGYKKMAEFYASKGVTSFQFTTMTLPKDDLINILSQIKKYIGSQYSGGAIAQGVYLEGPFISPLKKGAQDESYISPPDINLFTELNKASGNNINVVTVAPEMSGSIEFIIKASKICKVSIAHTDADFETSVMAIENGASNITHLFNGMTTFHHRNSGTIGAGFDNDDVTIEMICDGVHIKPEVIRTVFKIAQDRIILISDSMMASGLNDGEYTLGGQYVKVEKSVARLKSGTIAGSASNLYDCVKNCINFGIKPELAIKSASYNPAKLIGKGNEIGSIKQGKYADLVLLDKHFNIKKVWIRGKEIII